MKLSRKSEYALLAMIYMAEHYKDGPIKGKDIAGSNNIPKLYLDQIMSMLRGGRYVRSQRGSSGGYRLAKNPRDITIAEILRLMDGALAPVESVSKFFFRHGPIEQNANLLNLFKNIRDYIADKLETTTLADMIEKIEKTPVNQPADL